MTKLLQTIVLVAFSISGLAHAQSVAGLKNKIKQIVTDKQATVGVSIMGHNGKDVVYLNQDKRFPMQSVFKFHIALAVLSQIDQGKFTLDQKIEIQKKDLLPDLWSPLREENPEGGSFPISTLIEYAVSVSDNVACDALLRLVGGPRFVEHFFEKNNIKNVSIKFNEEEANANPELSFQNWTTPRAANETLARFYYNKKNLLSKKSHEFIWQTMKATETGLNRLRGQLPKDAIIAHKTGSSGTNKQGITSAVNDIGIIFLPNGKYFFISVFVTNSKENAATNEKIIADIAKVAWDYFMAKTK
ncbi:MAG: class A beta-lactamase, subclass A2 [Bacteroidetes Order II. Incertae sedis bacterium]|nr:class A beta-lactamase, subclass A2 [Bacteroidetes Order II. bacterium]